MACDLEYDHDCCASLTTAEDTLALYREAFHAIEVEAARFAMELQQDGEVGWAFGARALGAIAHNALLGQATVRK